MPSSVPAVKAGLRDYLSTTVGLRSVDGVTIHRADPDPQHMQKEQVVLGTATTSQDRAGLAGRAESCTLTVTVMVSKPGTTTAATTAAARAYELEGYIVDALAADPTAAGAVPPPGQLDVTGSTFEEFPIDWDGSAMRRAQLQLSLSWTSHVT